MILKLVFDCILLLVMMVEDHGPEFTQTGGLLGDTV